MFSKKHRINKKLFADVFYTGKTIKTPLFLLKYKKNEENICRIAVVTPKKNFKTAVLRNKIRRFFKNTLKNTEIIKKNYDLIFVLNKQIEKQKKDKIILLINEICLK